MNFNQAAPFYDFLTRQVFGRTWKKLQVQPAERLNQHSNILIIGGGTGAILPHLSSSLKVTYVEMSSKMIEIAKKRVSKAEVEFVEVDFLVWKFAAKYDAIYTPFFLDCFELEQLQYVTKKAKMLLRDSGELHVLDFQKSGFVKNIMVKIMYWFFRLTANLRTERLPNIQEVLITQKFVHKDVQFFLGSWVFYRIYKPMLDSLA